MQYVRPQLEWNCFFSAMVYGTKTTLKRRKKTPLNIATSRRTKTVWQWWYRKRPKRSALSLALWSLTCDVRWILDLYSMWKLPSLNRARTSGARAPAAAHTSHATRPNAPREVKRSDFEHVHFNSQNLNTVIFIYYTKYLCTIDKGIYRKW